MVLFGGAARMRDVMSPAQTQALLSLVTQDWDLFADSAAQAWLGWGSGETGRLTAAAFRSAAAPATAQAWFSAALSIDVSERVAQVTAPTLVLHRQGEGQLPVEVSRSLAEALPHGRLIVLPGSSPTLFLEYARGDLDLVTEFLTSGRILAPGPVRVARDDSELTGRELDVLRLLAAGDSNAEIARRLGIAVHTVERHVSNLYRKIGARGRADATAYALRGGLV
jgi:DNA-binding CsgD family transcriptional regulator